jgi:F0F1-type ATP synthase assembly protein I
MTSKENETSKLMQKKKAAQLAKRKEDLKKLIKAEPKKASKS